MCLGTMTMESSNNNTKKTTTSNTSEAIATQKSASEFEPQQSVVATEEDDHLAGDADHKKRTWEESFALLQAYRDKHGNCHVPIRYDEDRRLGRWVYSQRTRRDKLTPEQIRRLEELGFETETMEDDNGGNDHAEDSYNARQSLTASHARHEEDVEDDEDEDESDNNNNMPPPPSSVASSEDGIEIGFTHTGRRRKAVRRYGITDNDDESDIARRKKERQEQGLDSSGHNRRNSTGSSVSSKQAMPQHHHQHDPQSSSAAALSKAPIGAYPDHQREVLGRKQPESLSPPPPSIAEEEDIDEDDDDDEDYDSEVERRAREKRRKQRQQQLHREHQQQLQQRAAHHEQQSASSSSKRGRPIGRPRGRPRKETVEEKIAQIVEGSRVAVLWVAENTYYHGTVTKVVPTRKRPYYLEYDDGETEWIDFAKAETDFLVLDRRTGPRKRNRSKASASASSTATTPSKPKSMLYENSSPAPSASKASNKNYSHCSNHGTMSHPPIRVGCRVSVYWSDDEQYYDATVVKQRKDINHPQPYKLEYGEGEYEWIDLYQHKFHFLDDGNEGRAGSPGRARKRRSQMDSDSDDESEEDGDDEMVVTSTPRAKVVDESSDDEDSDSASSDSSSNSSSGSSSASNVENYADDDDSDMELVSDLGQVRVGARVAVYWSDHERYYEGKVTDHRKGHPTPFFMQYDDGDSQWLDLRNRNFCVLKKARRSKRNGKRRKKHFRKQRQHQHIHHTPRRRRIDDDSSDSGSGSSSSEEGSNSDARHSSSQTRQSSRKSTSPFARRNQARSQSDSTSSSDSSDQEESSSEPQTQFSDLPPPDKVSEVKLGTRLSIFCPVRGKYMDGTVTHRQIPRNRRKKPCYFIEYDKGHFEWIELPKRQVRLLHKSSSSLPPMSARKSKKSKPGRKRVHDSPLVRMLRQKEERRASLLAGVVDPAIGSPVQQEATKPVEPEQDCSSSSESEMPLSEDEISEVDKQLEKKPTVAPDQIGIGSRIAVQCPLQLKFMEGTVTRLIRNRRKPFYIEYDIGGSEWIDVNDCVVRLLTFKEERLLKEQSAIVIKEEVEDALPPIPDENMPEIDLTACDSSSDEDDDPMEVVKSDSEPANKEKPENKEIRKPVTVTKNKVQSGAAVSESTKQPDTFATDKFRLSDRPAKPSHVATGDSSIIHNDDITMPSLNDEEPQHVSPDEHDDDASHKDDESDAKMPDAYTTDAIIPSNGAGIKILKINGCISSPEDSPTAVTCAPSGDGGNTSVVKNKDENGNPVVVSDALITGLNGSNDIRMSIGSSVVEDSLPTEQKITQPASVAPDVIRTGPVAIVSDISTDTKTSNVAASPENSSSRLNVDLDENECQQKSLSTANLKPFISDEISSPVKQDGLVKGDNTTLVDHGDAGVDDKENGSVTPLKRKRGRPPKSRSKFPKPNDDDVKPVAEVSGASPSSNKETDATPTPKKRGPGRPPKRKNISTRFADAEGCMVAPTIESEMQEERLTSNDRDYEIVVDERVATREEEDSINENTKKVTKSRGPGRPPKNSTSKEEQDLSPSVDDVLKDSDDEVSFEMTRSPSRRGRGRPPKKYEDSDFFKKKTPSHSAKHAAGEVSSKNASTDINENSAVKPRKRGPGRPPKSSVVPAEVQSSPEVAEPVKKRGPGRPRKSESEKSTKRGPGRPRKTPKKEKSANGEDDESSIDIFKVTMLEGCRQRKETNRFSPTNYDDSDSDSSESVGEPVDAKKKFVFGDDHSKLANQIEVGTRVSVYWGGDEKYYAGTVTRERSYRKKKFFLEYDDGEQEWIDFHANKFKILAPAPNAGKKRGIDDSSDEEGTSVRSAKRRSSDSETDPSNLIRNRMDMADVMSRITIGTRVEVFWSEDDCYYPGTITKQRENIIQAKKPFFLLYDDGESEWIDLRDHVFRMLDDGDKPPATVEVEEVKEKFSTRDKIKKEMVWKEKHMVKGEGNKDMASKKRKRDGESDDSVVKKFRRLKKKKVAHAAAPSSPVEV